MFNARSPLVIFFPLKMLPSLIGRNICDKSSIPISDNPGRGLRIIERIMYLAVETLSRRRATNHQKASIDISSKVA